MSKAVTKKEDNLPSTIEDEIFETAGEGIDYDTSELQIPFLRIVQAMSPQLKKTDPKYIEGASQGDMFNTVTGQYWDGEEGIVVIPCYQETKYLEFVPRDAGGGFKGEIAPDNPIIQKVKREGTKEWLPNGNELIKSDQHYCIILDGDIPQLAIMDMKVSQLKVSRRLKTQMQCSKLKIRKANLLYHLFTQTCGSSKLLRKAMIKVRFSIGLLNVSVLFKTRVFLKRLENLEHLL